MEVKGSIAAGYETIYDSFLENFNEYGEIGASLCVFYRHEKVVDIWGGLRDRQKQKAWREDTVVPVFSTTKAVAASCLAICHSRGLFRYTDRVAEHWKAFGENGKADISIGELLQHRAGLSAVDHQLKPRTIADRPYLHEILAGQKVRWQPGVHQGYHVWTIGWYISALLSHLDPRGRMLEEFVNQEIVPHIEGEVRIGVGKDYPMDQIATLKPFSKLRGLLALPPPFVLSFFNPWSLTFRSMLNPAFVSDHSNFNKPEILQLEIGSGGGIANARGLASLLDGLNSPDHPLFLSRESRDYLETYPAPPESGYRDIVFKEDAFRFHAGFMKPSDNHDFSDSRAAYGGFGAGGSFVFTDPAMQLTIAYTMNKMDSKMMNIEREVNIRRSVRKAIMTMN